MWYCSKKCQAIVSCQSSSKPQKRWPLYRESRTSHTKRPLTHDFMSDLLRQMKAKPTELRITDCRDETFYAKLAVESDGAEHQIDCRPSDGLCVAVREGAPIVVNAELIANVGRQQREPLDGSGIEQIAAQLRGDSPGPTFHVGE